jgi:hypothetical protein
MIHLLVAMMLTPVETGIPQKFMIPRDQGTAVPVTDKDLRPVRPPDCKTDADTARAVEQVRSGEQGECWVKDARAFSRRGG